MFVTAYNNRNSRFEVTIFENGSLFTVTSSDIVYVKIGRNNETPVFEFSSANATANGSSVSAANPAVVEIKQEDLLEADIPPGTYDIEVGVVDASDEDDFKIVQKGTFVLHQTMAGDDTRSEF